MDGQSWRFEAYIKSGVPTRREGFGQGLALGDNTLIVGAPRDTPGALGRGRVYVYTRAGTIWSLVATLEPDAPDTGDGFGGAVSYDDGRIAVGADSEASGAVGINGNQFDNSVSRAGAAYVFAKNGASWVQEAYVKASNTDGGDRFGKSVSIASNTLIVGASLEDSFATTINGDQGNFGPEGNGAAYVFSLDGSQWSQTAYLKPSTADDRQSFGSSVCQFQDTVAIGAPERGQTGAVFMFQRTVEGSWIETGAFIGSAVSEVTDLGERLDCSSGLILAGAFAGGPIIYSDNEGWSESRSPVPSSVEVDDRYGQAVAVDGIRFAVSAAGDDSSTPTDVADPNDGGATDSGAVYVFQ